jgi:hypothetical protein
VIVIGTRQPALPNKANPPRRAARVRSPNDPSFSRKPFRSNMLHDLFFLSRGTFDPNLLVFAGWT